MNSKRRGPATRERTHTSTTPLRDADAVFYRIAAIPADATEADDLILSDGHGQTYLMSGRDTEPSRLERAEANALGLFFEPSQDSSWHTLTELRALIYGGSGAAA